MNPDLSQISTDALVSELQRRRDNISEVLHSVRSNAVDSILDAVCEAFGVNRSFLMEQRSTENHVNVRWAAIILLRDHGLGWSEIGEILNIDHGTAIHAAKRHHIRLESHPRYREGFMMAESRITNPMQTL